MQPDGRGNKGVYDPFSPTEQSEELSQDDKLLQVRLLRYLIDTDDKVHAYTVLNL